MSLILGTLLFWGSSSDVSAPLRLSACCSLLMLFTALSLMVAIYMDWRPIPSEGPVRCWDIECPT